jgi:hypothetical protein
MLIGGREGTDPGQERSRRGRSWTWRRFMVRVRWETTSSRRSESKRSTTVWSSAATTESLGLWMATDATDTASVTSVLRALPEPSSRARAASLAGTSTTRSPAARRCWATPCPRPAAPSTAHSRSGHSAAQEIRWAPVLAVVASRRWPSVALAELRAAAVTLALWGSMPITITLIAFRRWDGNHDGQPDFRRSHASVEPRRAGADRPGGLVESHPKGQGAMRATRSAPSAR